MSACTRSHVGKLWRVYCAYILQQKGDDQGMLALLLILKPLYICLPTYTFSSLYPVTLHTEDHKQRKVLRIGGRLQPVQCQPHPAETNIV